MLEQVEKRVFFTITRVFAWVVILPAFLALVFAGYKVATSYVAGHKSIEVTYEEVKAELERQENPWNAQKPADTKKKKDRKDDWKNEADLKELLDILGNQVDRPKAEEIIKTQVMRHDPKDRTEFIRGIISIVKRAPIEKRLLAIDAYISLWDAGASLRDTEEMALKGERSSQLWMLGAAFGVIAMFSLILILLAIEKNTRRP